jgi:predicted dehydrogenase
MKERLRVGLIGVAHPHVWGVLTSLKDGNLGTLCAASLDKPARESDKERLQRDYNVAKIYGDYHEMLDEENIDVVFNYTDHLLRTPVTQLATSRGLHVMVEKPMAYNLKDGERMLEAAEENNVKLMVNWPTMWSAAYRKMNELVKNGTIGRIFQIRARAGHNSCERENYVGSCFQWMGQKGAAGAYLDFCCYGVALAVSLMGMPKRVFGTAGNFVKDFIPSYDNGIVVMMYDKGMAAVEGTWSQIGRIPVDPVIYGTKGSILLGSQETKVFTKDKQEGEAMKVDPLPQGERNAVEYFLTRIKEDRPIESMCNQKFSRDVQEILEAGLISSKSGTVTMIPLNEDR